MKRCQRAIRCLAMAAGLLLVQGCSAFTSISREANGDYVLTGWQAPGPRGFIWICKYDPATKTLTVKEELPR